MAMQETDIEMGMQGMDTGEVVLGSEDEILRNLFAQDDDQQADDEGQKQASIRTASTSTVGTKPSGGVSKIGGSTTGGSSEPSLDGLWKTAPDVRDVFGIPNN